MHFNHLYCGNVLPNYDIAILRRS